MTQGAYLVLQAVFDALVSSCASCIVPIFDLSLRLLSIGLWLARGAAKFAQFGPTPDHVHQIVDKLLIRALHMLGLGIVFLFLCFEPHNGIQLGSLRCRKSIRYLREQIPGSQADFIYVNLGGEVGIPAEYSCLLGLGLPHPSSLLTLVAQTKGRAKNLSHLDPRQLHVPAQLRDVCVLIDKCERLHSGLARNTWQGLVSRIIYIFDSRNYFFDFAVNF